MANKERLLQLADIVQNGHHKFNGIHAALMMGNWLIKETDFNKQSHDLFIELMPVGRKDIGDDIFKCNTVACIAGFTCLLFDYEKASTSNYGTYHVESKAQELLELTYAESQELFMHATGPQITGPMAAKVIRKFAETDEIDWGEVYSL